MKIRRSQQPANKAFSGQLPHLAGPSSSFAEGILGELSRFDVYRHGGAIKRRGGQRGGKQSSRDSTSRGGT